MANAPLVSVLMPAYNVERYITYAIKSILYQTLKDLEIIVIDDGSTDDTWSKLSAIAHTDPRIRLFRQQNIGIAATRNRCMEEAKGPYLAWLDADDIAEPCRLDRQLRHLDSNSDCVALGSEFVVIDEDDEVLWRSQQAYEHPQIEEKLWRGSGSAILNSTLMVRSDVMKRVGAYDPKLRTSEDLDLLLRLAEVGRLTNLPDSLVKYRRHPGGISATGDEEQAMARRKSILIAASVRRGRAKTTLHLGDYPQPVTLTEWHALTASLGLIRGARRRIVVKHAVRALRLDISNRSAQKALLKAIFGSQFEGILRMMARWRRKALERV